MVLAGALYRPVNVADAERKGVALVPQEINVVPELSVAENICLNAAPGRFGMIDVAARLARARDALRDFDLAIDPLEQATSFGSGFVFPTIGGVGIRRVGVVRGESCGVTRAGGACAHASAGR